MKTRDVHGPRCEWMQNRGLNVHRAQALSLREMAGGWDALDELKREARLLASLHHPGIPRRIADFEVRPFYTPSRHSNKLFLLTHVLIPGGEQTDLDCCLRHLKEKRSV